MTPEKATMPGLALMLVACAGAAQPPPGSAESAPPLVGPEANARAPLDAPVVALDSSLTWPIYRAAGVPEIDRAWSVDDYRRGVQIFGKMAGVSRAELPRRDSPRSGVVFARLVDRDNFAAVAAPGAAEPRARLGQDYLEVYPGLLQLYAPATDGLDFGVEQGELIVALFELQKAVSVGVLRGVGAMLLEDGRYSAALRQRLKRETARLGPELASHLDADRSRLIHDIIRP
jgi:hypothetical protein